MPIFEYECLSCEHRFEVIDLHRNEEGPKRCPKCGEFALISAVLSAPSIIKIN